MAEINWSLLNSGPNLADTIISGFQRGQQMGRERDFRGALANYAKNSNDPNALVAVMQHNPELAMRLSEHNDKRQFNSALGDYLAPRRSALPSRPTGNPGDVQQPSADRPLPAARDGAGFDEAFAPLSAPNALSGLGQGALSMAAPSTMPARGALNPLMPQGGMPGQMPPMPGMISGYGGGTFDTTGRPGDPMTANDPAAADDGPDLSFLGEPQTPRDQAFLRMVRRDPEKALKIQSTLRDNFLDQLKDSQSFYGIAVEELARVRDDAGWQVALGRLAPYAERLGVDLGESVPLTYPGDEEVAALMERALPVKDRLGHLLRSADVAADNARADRNTDSLIADRGARRGEVSRNNARRDATARRGQDIRSSTTQRGQDLRGAGGGRENIPTVKTPEEARKLAPGTKFKTPDGRIKIR